jgi:hypothetical protein
MMQVCRARIGASGPCICSLSVDDASGGFLNDLAKTEAQKAGDSLPGISRAHGGPSGIFSVGELRVLFDSKILHSQARSWKPVRARAPGGPGRWC